MTVAQNERGGGTVEPPSILAKAFDVLQAFNSTDRVMTLSELSRATGLSKSTVHRLLARLVDLGAIEHHRNAYKLGLGLLKLGATTPAGAMRDEAMPFLAALHRWSGHTVHFGVLRQSEVVYLDKLSSPKCPLTTLTGVGTRLPAHCTAIGKALLAFEDLDQLAGDLSAVLPGLTQHSIRSAETLLAQLWQVKETGLSRERDESQAGVACVAAPILVNGYAVGAVSVGHSSGMSSSTKLDAAVRETAGQISRAVRTMVADREHLYPFSV